MLEKEISGLKIIEFSTVVTLNKSNGKKEVGSYISLEVKKNSVYIRFVTQGKGPNKVGKIIKDNKIIFKAGDTRMW